MKRLLLSAPLFFCACTRSASRPLIACGDEVNPWSDTLAQSLVAIVKEENLGSGKTLCSGTLLSDDLVLTAAHCFLDIENPTSLMLVMGAHVRETPASHRRRVEIAWPHEGFSKEDALSGSSARAPNDIALVRFSGSIPEGMRMQPLADASFSIPDEITLAGYGLQSLSDLQSTGFLKRIQGRVLEQNRSRRTLVVESLSGSGCGALPGDSGGPAVASGPDGLVQIGVDSTGSHDALGAFSGRNSYTDVRAYRAWLDSASKALREFEGHARAPRIAFYAFRDANGVGFTLTNNDSEPLVCRLEAYDERGAPLPLPHEGAATLPPRSAESPLPGFAVFRMAGVETASIKVGARCDRFLPLSRQLAIGR